MTDPQELNSIDKLYRDTFSRLPASPDPGGWDAPSEQVWVRIRRETGFSTYFTFRNSRWMLAALTVGVVVAGMYLLRQSGNNVAPTDEKTDELPAVNQPIVVESQASKQNTTGATVPVSRIVSVVRESNDASQIPASRHATSPDTPASRMKGAAPLPGTAKQVAPNTTEERRAALEQIWRTPLDMLPVPRR